MQVSSIITEFNLDESINKIDHHPYITIIGQRFSGKSVLINELVYQKHAATTLASHLYLPLSHMTIPPVSRTNI